MLHINGLTLTLTKNMRILVEDMSFTLNGSDKAVLIGEEGNGKSTLLKLLYDEALVENYAEWSGMISKTGLNLGYLPQEMPLIEQALSIYEYINDDSNDMSPADFIDIAKRLSLDADFLYSSRLCSTLSGGEKVKLQLIKILSAKPDILLLDEPSNDLDLETLSWLEAFIADCRQPVLFISHDETLIEKTANVIIHLEQLRKKTTPRHTISKMSYRRYVDLRTAALERQEQLARKEKAEYDKKTEKWQQIHNKVEHEQASISRQNPAGGRLLKKKMKAVKSQGRRYEREKEEMTQLPDVEESIFAVFGDGVSIPSSKDILRLYLDELSAGATVLSRNIELNVIGAEHIAITGRNGSGKTTLLKQIAAILALRNDIKAAYMPQNYEDLLDMTLTPVDFLSKSGKKDEVTQARTFLGSMKYTHEEMLVKISELSGGQKAKLLFMKMVLDGNNVLVLDEPTRNFSPLSGPVIRKALRDYPGTIISVSHDRKYLSEVCQKIYELTANGLLITHI